MKFKSLNVYIQPHSSGGGLKARVIYQRGNSLVCRSYGANLLKKKFPETICEAMEISTRALLGTTEKIVFSFDPKLSPGTDTITYEYPPPACTCHPQEAPVPCQRKYALADCVESYGVQREPPLPIRIRYGCGIDCTISCAMNFKDVDECHKRTRNEL